MPDMNLRMGSNDNPIYKHVHDMEMMLSSHPRLETYYLLLCADVRWPSDPEPGTRRVFTILMQYSPSLGQNVGQWPAHVMDVDAPEVFRRLEAFVRKNMG